MKGCSSALPALTQSRDTSLQPRPQQMCTWIGKRCFLLTNYDPVTCIRPHHVSCSFIAGIPCGQCTEKGGVDRDLTLYVCTFLHRLTDLLYINWIHYYSKVQALSFSLRFPLLIFLPLPTPGRGSPLPASHLRTPVTTLYTFSLVTQMCTHAHGSFYRNEDATRATLPLDFQLTDTS